MKKILVLAVCLILIIGYCSAFSWGLGSKSKIPKVVPNKSKIGLTTLPSSGATVEIVKFPGNPYGDIFIPEEQLELLGACSTGASWQSSGYYYSTCYPYKNKILLKFTKPNISYYSGAAKTYKRNFVITRNGTCGLWYSSSANCTKDAYKEICHVSLGVTGANAITKNCIWQSLTGTADECKSASIRIIGPDWPDLNLNVTEINTGFWNLTQNFWKRTC